MSTTTSAPVATGLAITRAERDAIHRDLHFGLEADRPQVDEAGMHDALRRVELRIAFCDALGWEQDDPRDEYRLPDVPAGELRHWLRRWGDESAQCVQDELHHDEPGYFTSSPGYLKGLLATMTACVEILGRLDEAGA